VADGEELKIKSCVCDNERRGFVKSILPVAIFASGSVARYVQKNNVFPTERRRPCVYDIHTLPKMIFDESLVA
jgi:hypothetical protein